MKAWDYNISYYRNRKCKFHKPNGIYFVIFATVFSEAVTKIIALIYFRVISDGLTLLVSAVLHPVNAIEYRDL